MMMKNVWPVGLVVMVAGLLGGCGIASDGVPLPPPSAVVGGMAEAGHQARPDMPPLPAPRTRVYVCAELEFVVRAKPGEVAVFLPRRTVLLPQVRSASGAKFSGDGVTFWSKGKEALLVVDGREYRGCELDYARIPWEDAKLSGVDFRAVGNEPGWHLEIREGDRIRLVTDYGQTEVQVPAPKPQLDQAGARATYHARTEAHELEVMLEGRPCHDTMSGEAFETSVTVWLDGRVYYGCGRALH